MDTKLVQKQFTLVTLTVQRYKQTAVQSSLHLNSDKEIMKYYILVTIAIFLTNSNAFPNHIDLKSDDDNIETRNEAEPCPADPSACVLPDCRCSSTSIPGGFTRDEIPQVEFLRPSTKVDTL